MSNAGTKHGIVAPTTIESHDKLPKIVREFIANSLVPWNTDWILAQYEAKTYGFTTAEEVVETMRAHERMNHTNAVLSGEVPRSKGTGFAVKQLSTSRVTRMANRSRKR